jgi:ABC-type Na+ efflux pump permease subunit
MQPSETTVTSGLAEALDSDTDSESDNMSAQSEIDEAVQFSESSGTSSSDESQLESDVESSRAGTQTPKVKESEDMRKVKHVASFFFCLFLLWVCLNYVSMSAASLLLPVFPGLICALMPSGAQPLLNLLTPACLC